MYVCNALTVAFSHACLEIRWRNEVINSTQNRIYSLKVYRCFENALNLIYPISSLRKTHMALITQQFLVPVSTVSAMNARHNDLPFVP